MSALTKTDAERALQIYLLLIGKAENRQTTQYGLLIDRIGYPWGGPLLGKHVLGRIMLWCQRQGLPALTELVVNKETGMPGAGLTAVSPEQHFAERERVFNHDWSEVTPPTVEELQESGCGDVAA